MLGPARADLFPPGPGESAGTGPLLEAAVRYGLTPRVELGAKVFAIGGAIETKVQLVTGGRLDLAIAPSTGYGLYAPSGHTNAAFHILHLQLPLLIGINLGEHQLVVAPKLIDEVWLGAGDGSHGSRQIRVGGASVGLAFRISGSVTVMPEGHVVNARTPTTTSGPASVEHDGAAQDQVHNPAKPNDELTQLLRCGHKLGRVGRDDHGAGQAHRFHAAFHRLDPRGPQLWVSLPMIWTFVSR